MKIGFDAKRIVRNNTGLGNYGRTLVNNLSRVVPDGTSLCLYAPDSGNETLRRQVVEAPNISFAYPNGSMPRWYWRSHGIVSDLKRDGIQLFHGLSGELPFGIHKAGIHTVVTIHDLIFLRHPEYYKPIDRLFYGWKFRHTVREADRIIAISECTKRDIMHFGKVPSEKIDLIYQSCSTYFKQRESEQKLQEVNSHYMLPPRYVIGVGTIEERKNMLLAVKAMLLLPEELSLILVGRPTPYADEIRRFIEEHRLGQRVRMLHNVPNADLPAIYQMAEVAVYPSRYEGFGIPVIEAIQSGLPVVAGSGSCLEEAGGPDTLYVSPDDVEGMAAAITQVLKGAKGRQQRIERAQDYIHRFEGNDVASQVLDIYLRFKI